MSRIQSSIGLITGVPIQDTVDQLIAISARPRDLLEARNEGLQQQQLALDQLTSLVLGVQFEIGKLKDVDTFQSRVVNSSNTEALSASVSPSARPPIGQFQFTPVQTAAAHQLLSSPLGESAAAEGISDITIQFGGHVDAAVELSQLNDGRGVSAGQIIITDRSGESQQIDLRFAQTIDDVLDEINSAEEIRVTARAVGDAIELTDTTGLDFANLKVQEVGIGTTALDLGLAGVDTNSATAVGDDIVHLHDGTLLETLNDGNGVSLQAEAADLELTFRDGSSHSVDLGDATTLGDVLNALNSADPGKLRAEISDDGERLRLTDLTAGTGEFSVENAVAGTTATDLGLDGPVFARAITGRRLLAGLKSTLLASLKGGQGTGDLGIIQITDRSGVTAAVDLLPAESLDDVLAAINSAGVGVLASVNADHSGIVLRDTTGASGNLIVASADASNTADLLGIAVDDAVDGVDGGSLNRQRVGHATKLEDFATGVSLGSFVVQDSRGNQGAVKLTGGDVEITTIGGVVDAINALKDIEVEARINDTGDGILLTDLANGSGSLQVREVGNGTTAADLRLLGESTAVLISGQSRHVIDGSTSETIQLSSQISLAALNGGSGVELGKFTVRDSAGNSKQVSLNSPGSEAVTIGDVVDAINDADVNVLARINDQGTGIILIDQAGGSGTLSVTQNDSNSTAADLGIDGASTLVNIDGEPTQVIDAADLFDATSFDIAAVNRVIEDVNSRQAGFVASRFFDGRGHRLAISSESTGAGRELLVGTGQQGVSFAEVTPPRDALLFFQIGQQGGVLLPSETNTIDDVIEGVTLNIKTHSDVPVTISVDTTDANLVDAVDQFASAYNSLRDALDQLTTFDVDSGSAGLLFGTNEALQVETSLSRLITQPIFGLGQFTSLGELGVDIDGRGRLTLDRAQLQEAFAKDPDAVEKFFSDEDRGIAVQFDKLIEQLAREDGSVLSRGHSALSDKIDVNSDRIEFMNARLDAQRELLLKQFFQTEQIVARMQADLAALSRIQPLPPLSVSQSQNT